VPAAGELLALIIWRIMRASAPPPPARLSKELVAEAMWEAYTAVREQGLGLVGAWFQRTCQDAYELFVEVYVYPEHVWQVVIACATFFVLMLSICHAVESQNPTRNDPKRQAQIRKEIAESFPAVVASTSASLAHFRWLYPLRWGHKAAVLPSSLGVFAGECVYWMVCFEVFVYALHRFLHWRRPVDVYKWIHRSHHLFFFPSAFAAQAIHPVEAILFAETSLLATVFLFPISVATQYFCGVLLLIWSILAHDSRFLLDKGAHYEHHSHPQTNFGFLGFMDILMQTVWWGHAYDSVDEPPKYFERQAFVHRLVFGVSPRVARDGQAEDSELQAKICAAGVSRTKDD
jgi:sterol desaturase/sphingolipid hydroxylase (fatty acid hydroxylase superfamily)